MSRDYGRVYTSFWNSPDIRSLSDDGRHAALFLLTNPHSNIIGAYLLPDAYLMDGLQWDGDRVRKALSELFAKPFAKRFRDGRHIVICKYLEWNPIENRNVGMAAVKQAEQLDRMDPAFEYVMRGLSLYRQHFKDEWEAVSLRLSQPELNGLGTPSEGLPKQVHEPVQTPELEQEPEPEPEPELEREGARAQTDAVAEWKPGDPFPEGWKAEAAPRREALMLGPCDVNLEAERFVLWYAQHGLDRPNWHAAWISWVLRAHRISAERASELVKPVKAPPPTRRFDVWGGHPAVGILRAELGEDLFEKWLAVCILKITDEVPILQAPTRSVRDMIWNRYIAQVERAFERPVLLELQVSDASQVVSMPVASTAPGADSFEIPAFLKREQPKKVSAA
ncbi:MAG: hypothetical protein A3E01_02965 [Gammaproteobacteria bacterium RIFCSPHIGHO2_12_FULL_63_22]|nr:MAG: hypothetical protein A3E01_02965 [Gammaproteobacteria bacterium RIFCSPHIGHO2_12_FULL_63_22]